MIGLGSQYLTAAGFGKYRITAASLGNLDLLGTWRWLTGAKQAILAAFGDDGMAVINATNAYLNGIAASDRDKATALAALLNEDPMMVCSLGLQPQGVTMPIRGLKGDGTAYIKTGYFPTQDTEVICQFKLGTYRGNFDKLYGVQTTGSYFIMAQMDNTNNHLYVCFGNNSDSHRPYFTFQAGEFHTINAKKGTISIDSDVRTISTVSDFTSQYQLYLYAGNWANNQPAQVTNSELAGISLSENGNYARQYLPFRLGKTWSADKVSTGVAQAKDTLGMIDLVTGIFYPNAASSGAFTMEGEPTPSTP